MQCRAVLGRKTPGGFRFRRYASGLFRPHPSPPMGSPISCAIEHATDLLPRQGILEHFVHHNPLAHLECMPFKEAIDYTHKLESYMSPGERMFTLVNVDPRKRVNEAVSELASTFLDRGSAKWAPLYRDKGFLFFFASLEGLGFAPWRRHARGVAKEVLRRSSQGEDAKSISEAIVRDNLEFFGVPEEEWTSAIRAMLLELRGWAGMFRRMETHPSEAPAGTKLEFVEFCAVQSILYRSSVMGLARQSGWDTSSSGRPLAAWLSKAPQYRHHEEHNPHSSAIAFVDQSSERQESLENEFENTLLHTIRAHPPKAHGHRPKLQLYTCIDDRECSFRRHVEEANPREIETFGVAGFFGIPIRYQPADGRGQMILAPEGQNPTAILVEDEDKTDKEKAVLFHKRRHSLARLGYLWENASFSPLGSLLLSLLAPISSLRLLLMGFSPSLKQRMEEYFHKVFIPKPHTEFQLPFPPNQAAALLARTFKDIGTHKRFAPIVIVLGHGAISQNNPFAAAYNCGACGGSEGGPNARLLARLANHPEVREHLRKDHDITIPDDTVFLGGEHNTTTDTVKFYDLGMLPESHSIQFLRAQLIIDRARGQNALERCHRFLLAKHVHTPQEALKHVEKRSSDLAEARPELNHATNAAVVIGRRELTKGHNLDRRVFLPSYDPFSDDPQGTNLEHVLSPALVVCSGINLEYLFSTIEADHHGAGTKAPLNIVGNIGVLQGTTGDLRPGLPTQMTEMHTPVRSLFLVDAPMERVEAVLSRREDLRQIVRNEWVRLLVRDPESHLFFRQAKGSYVPVHPTAPKRLSSFRPHLLHGMHVASREDKIYWLAAAAMVLSTVLPILASCPDCMNPRGPIIALSAAMLSLPVLSFARRYLHGEFMFGRFSALCVGLLLGFNLVATAPNLATALGGWSLFGFASTFLIAAYNDRPTVRNNATYAFAAYKISDFAMLVAATFSAHQLEYHGVAAAGLLVAAVFKSSQFPLTPLFVRSMEGPTPASALGYAGLSAHVGVVLLTSTLPLWFDFWWARAAIASIGLFTAVYASLISKVRSDRKGAIANATSATLGLIFVLLALGHSDLALLLCLGHAAFRMIQILRSPNMIADSQAIRSGLGYMPWPKVVPPWLYRLSWTLRRVDTDFHLLNVLMWMTRHLHRSDPPVLSKARQWSITGLFVVLAGAPFTPLSHYEEHLLMDLLLTQPYLAGAIMVAHFGIAVILIRFLLLQILDRRRFGKKTQSQNTL